MRLTWLVDEKLAASGMIFPEDIPLLSSQGIGSVLSLTESSPFPEGTPDGIVHMHLPVIDMTAPSRGILDRAVEFLAGQLEEGRAVLVHCAAGLGRTGTILAAFLVSRGAEPADAIRLVREVRPGSIETFDQEASIFAYGEAGADD